MGRSSFTPYLLLGLFLFAWVSLPKSLVDRMRAWSVGAVTPFSEQPVQEEVSRLKRENQHLAAQVEMAYEWLLADRHVNELAQVLKEFGPAEKQTPVLQRRADHMKERLKAEAIALPASVIYRDSASWSNSLWINVGQEDNARVKETVVAKNSPVLAEGNLVGVVDYVGRKQSRIRLITDAGLSPAVRAVRGAIQDREMARLIKTLSERIKGRADLFASGDEQGQLLDRLNRLNGKLKGGTDEDFLAKGQLMGSISPFWRSKGQILKGVGFNFAYPDEPLKTGVPLLREGDFVVTSGLDGVFPSGIPVGVVTQVTPPDIGGYSYEIEVQPMARNLNDLQTVSVLPPLSGD